jgi:hypothetical protein
MSKRPFALKLMVYPAYLALCLFDGITAAILDAFHESREVVFRGGEVIGGHLLTYSKRPSGPAQEETQP